METTHVYARATRRTDLETNIAAILDSRCDEAAKIVKRHMSHQAKCAVGEASKPISDRAKGNVYDHANVLVRNMEGYKGSDLPRPRTMADVAGIVRAWRGKAY